MKERSDLLQGTLDALLKALWGDNARMGHTERIEQWWSACCKLGQGTLSGALRLKSRLIRSEWRVTENIAARATTR